MSSTNAHQSPHLPEDHPAGANRFLPAGVGSPLVRENVRATPGNAAGVGVAQTMEQLTLVGLSDGRDRLLLVDSTGARYTVDVDNALRSAVRGEQPRPGHLETRMDSALRPRDIQARIRAGETAEAVAAAAGSTVEKIMPYAAPVLAERAHVAERAQKSSVRRRPGETSHFPGARTLEEAVATQLRSQNTDPTSVEWDAFRREDGRWSLTGLFETADRTGVATFIFDVPGNYVTAEDTDARWLVGDVVETPAQTVVDEAEGRRLSAVPSALGDDAIELVQSASDDAATARDTAPVAPQPTPAAPVAPPVAPAVAEERTIDLTETVNRIRGTQVPAPQAPQPAAPEVEAAPAAAAPVAPPTPAPAEPEAVEPVPAEAVPAEPEAKEAAPAQEAPAEDVQAEKPDEAAPALEQAPKKTSKRRGRASVPSWDEIMFGGGGGE